MIGLRRRAAPLVVILAAVLSGCAGVPKVDLTPNKSLAEKRQDRRQRVLEDFEKNRNQAEFQAALALWDKGDAEGCESALTKVLERTASHRDARLLLADCLLARNERTQAGQHMERALLDHPNDPSVQYAMGVFLDEVGRQDEAIGYYQRASTGAPKSEVYRVAYYSALEAANHRGAMQGEAIATAAEGVGDGGAGASLRPSGMLSPLPAPDGRLDNPRNPIQARESAAYIDPAAETDGSGDETPAAIVQRGRVALSEGEKEAAAACFRRAIAANPDNPQTAVSAAVAALRYDEPQMAIQLVRSVEGRFPKVATLKQTLGLACYRAGDYQGAQLALQQALSLDKSNALSYFLMGCTLARIGQLEAADTYLRQASTIDSRYATRR